MSFMRKFKRISEKLTKYLFSSEENRISRIVYKSVACFVFGALLTTLFVVTINNAKQRSGQGGLETSSIPEFDDYIDSQSEEVNVQLNEAAYASIQGGTDEILEEIFSEEEKNNQKSSDVKKDADGNTETVELTYLTYRVKSIQQRFIFTTKALIGVTHHLSRHKSLAV